MGFKGFPRSLPAFLAGLEKNNSKAWMDLKRGDYEACFVEPAKAFVEALLQRLGELETGLEGEPRVGGSIKRLNRDTRFSADKRPYDPKLHLYFWQSPKAKGAPGYHLVMGPDFLGVGTGLWAFGPKQQAAYRAAVCREEAATSLLEALESVEAAGAGSREEPELKKVPGGLSPVAALGEKGETLTRYKSLLVKQRFPLE